MTGDPRGKAMAESTTTRDFKVIGTRPIRPDGIDKVTGRAKFGADYAFPGMLHGKVLRSPHAHAIIKSIKIDKALKLPGVKAIVTSKDLPAAENKLEQSGEMTVNPMYLSMNPRARQGPVRRPRDRRRRRDQPSYRRGSGPPDRSRIRSAAARDDRRCRDQAGRA